MFPDRRSLAAPFLSDDALSPFSSLILRNGPHPPPPGAYLTKWHIVTPYIFVTHVSAGSYTFPFRVARNFLVFFQSLHFRTWHVEVFIFPFSVLATLQQWGPG